jgi:uncharacterized protein (DUF1800 family)
MDLALVALNRFGLGARPGERDALTDPAAARAWLHAQVGASSDIPTLPGTSLPDRFDASQALEGVRRTQAAARSSEDGRGDLAMARRELQQIRLLETTTLLAHRAATAAPFTERLVAFWSNHLCVSFLARQPLLALAGLYEREAVRPHVYSRFGDMLLASARHPGMLLYLDNARSTGPESLAARELGDRRRRMAARRTAQGENDTAPRTLPMPGLNENYARELLELHTLGVDGGYQQGDVEALAAMLTGWSVSGPAAPAGPSATASAGGPRRAPAPVEVPPLSFVFREVQHEPGPKTLLDRRYEQHGESQGEAAIRDLARHPSTARFVATKLATHFLSDTPPEPAVRALESAFLDSEGDLAEVSGVLVDEGIRWAASLAADDDDPGFDPPRKLRSPQDWVVASMRALVPTDPSNARRVVPLARGFAPILDRLRHPVWGPPSPRGFGDTIGDWSDPDALMNRAELSRSLGGRLSGARLDPARLASVVDLAPDDPLRSYLGDASIPASDRVALLLGGPAFQWR